MKHLIDEEIKNLSGGELLNGEALFNPAGKLVISRVDDTYFDADDNELNEGNAERRCLDLLEKGKPDVVNKQWRIGSIPS